LKLVASNKIAANMTTINAIFCYVGVQGNVLFTIEKNCRQYGLNQSEPANTRCDWRSGRHFECYGRPVGMADEMHWAAHLCELRAEENDFVGQRRSRRW
jgi:hypothetical protein